MTEERPPPPRSTLQVAGRVAEDVVGGLKQSPAILGLMVLNLLGMGVAVWFLVRFGEANAARFTLILERCLPST